MEQESYFIAVKCSFNIINYKYVKITISGDTSVESQSDNRNIHVFSLSYKDYIANVITWVSFI